MRRKLLGLAAIFAAVFVPVACAGWKLGRLVAPQNGRPTFWSDEFPA